MQKILIIDDHPLFRMSLTTMLKQHHINDEKFDVLEAEDAIQALQLIKKNKDIYLVLTDIEMPGMDGITLIQQIKTILPEVILAVISGSEKQTDVKQSLKLGAKGFIQKTAETSVLLAALQLIMAGGTYIPPLMLESDTTPMIKTDETITLTDRQMEILEYLRQGQQNKVIAHALDLSEATVKVHVRHIFSVLGVKNRTQAVQQALALGIL